MNLMIEVLNDRLSERYLDSFEEYICMLRRTYKMPNSMSKFYFTMPRASSYITTCLIIGNLRSELVLTHNIRKKWRKRNVRKPTKD